MRRSSRSSSTSVKTYNEDQLARDVESRAAACKNKKPSRIRKQAESDEEVEDDEAAMVVDEDGGGPEVVDDEVESDSDSQGNEEDESGEDEDQPLPRILAVRKVRW